MAFTAELARARCCLVAVSSARRSGASATCVLFSRRGVGSVVLKNGTAKEQTQPDATENRVKSEHERAQYAGRNKNPRRRRELEVLHHAGTSEYSGLGRVPEPARTADEANANAASLRFLDTRNANPEIDTDAENLLGIAKSEQKQGLNSRAAGRASLSCSRKLIMSLKNIYRFYEKKQFKSGSGEKCDDAAFAEILNAASLANVTRQYSLVLDIHDALKAHPEANTAALMAFYLRALCEISYTRLVDANALPFRPPKVLREAKFDRKLANELAAQRSFWPGLQANRKESHIDPLAVFEELKNSGKATSSTLDIIVGYLSRCGMVDKAREILDSWIAASRSQNTTADGKEAESDGDKEKPKLDVLQSTFTSVMAGYYRMHRDAELHDLFRKMQLEFTRPDQISYAVAISAAAREGNPEKAVLLFETMCQDGLAPTTGTFNPVLHALSRRGDLAMRALQSYATARMNGLIPDVRTFRCLMECARRAKDWYGIGIPVLREYAKALAEAKTENFLIAASSNKAVSVCKNEKENSNADVKSNVPDVSPKPSELTTCGTHEAEQVVRSAHSTGKLPLVLRALCLWTIAAHQERTKIKVPEVPGILHLDLEFARNKKQTTGGAKNAKDDCVWSVKVKESELENGELNPELVAATVSVLKDFDPERAWAVYTHLNAKPRADCFRAALEMCMQQSNIISEMDEPESPESPDDKEDAVAEVSAYEPATLWRARGARVWADFVAWIEGLQKECKEKYPHIGEENYLRAQLVWPTLIDTMLAAAANGVSMHDPRQALALLADGMTRLKRKEFELKRLRTLDTAIKLSENDTLIESWRRFAAMHEKPPPKLDASIKRNAMPNESPFAKHTPPKWSHVK